MEWLKYPENVPENYTWVIATLKTPYEIFVENVVYHDGHFILPGRGYTEFVTHWMPIPEPAKN
jgi:hypothetical protein